MFNAYDYLPSLPWVKAPADYRPVQYWTVYPKPQKLSSGEIAIDQCVAADGTVLVKLFDGKDDPRIEQLPPHTPRMVKAIFKRENRLKYLLATSYAPLMDFERAQAAWDNWVSPFKALSPV